MTASNFGDRVDPQFPVDDLSQSDEPDAVYDLIYNYQGAQRNRECVGTEQLDGAIADLHAAGIIDYRVVKI